MNNLISSRMKELRKDRGLTQKAVAASLGIGQTTVANYENGTRFPDLDKLGEIADLYEVSVDYLLGRSASAEPEPMTREPAQSDLTYDFRDYMTSLLEGNKKRIRKIMMALIASDLSSHDIYRDYLARSLTETGTLWERGDLPIWKEHFISEMTLENMALIKSRKQGEFEKTRPLLAVVPGAEAHSIGIRMISDELEAIGYQVIFLGNNIPSENIIQAIRENRPMAVLMSVTMPQHVDSVKLLIEKIKQTFGTKTPTILIGGSAFDRMKYVETVTGADKYCKTYLDIEKNLKRI